MSRPHLQHVLQTRHKFLGFPQCPCPLPSPHLVCLALVFHAGHQGCSHIVP